MLFIFAVYMNSSFLYIHLLIIHTGMKWNWLQMEQHVVFCAHACLIVYVLGPKRGIQFCMTWDSTTKKLYDSVGTWQILSYFHHTRLNTLPNRLHLMYIQCCINTNNPILRLHSLIYPESIIYGMNKSYRTGHEQTDWMEKKRGDAFCTYLL